MHIVFANQWYPPESGWGGVAMYNRTMAHALRRLGHRVTVISSRTHLSVPAISDPDGIRVIRLLVHDAYRWQRLPVIGRYVRQVQQFAYAWSVDRALRELYRGGLFDVVEFADVNAEGFFYARHPLTSAVVRCHTPSFVFMRYYERSEIAFDTRIISAGEKDFIHRANALTSPSHDMAHLIATECDISEDRISVIPNALSIDEFPSSPTHSTSAPTVLHVGRLERAKGVMVLAQAIPGVLRQMPNVRFVFVGGDRTASRGQSQRSELETQLSVAGVRANVEFTGAVDQMELVEWYRRADICVVPSMLYESFSYTCAQAMAAGKPVIASHIGGIPETISDGITGVIVEPGNVDQLVMAIVSLARDPARRERMGAAGRQRVSCEFDPIKIAQKNLAVYETV